MPRAYLADWKGWLGHCAICILMLSKTVPKSRFIPTMFFLTSHRMGEFKLFYEIKKDIYSVLYIKECTSDILCFRKIVSLTILFGNSKVEALKCEIGRLWSRHLTLVFKYEEYKQYAVLDLG